MERSKERFMVSDLARLSGKHANTIAKLLERGIIEPVEVIGRVKIFDKSTLAKIKQHYSGGDKYECSNSHIGKEQGTK